MSIVVNNKFSGLLGSRLLRITKVAQDTGISRTTLTNLYYKRTQHISFEVLDKLCKYLQCEIGDILEYKDD